MRNTRALPAHSLEKSASVSLLEGAQGFIRILDPADTCLAFKTPISNFWRRIRKKPRIPKTLRVIVKGTDCGAIV